MTILKLTYSFLDSLETKHHVNLYKDDLNQNNINPSNIIRQSYDRLFDENTEVGKIFYFSNRITLGDITTDMLYDNIVIQINSSSLVEPNTFLCGQNVTFYNSTNELFNKNYKYSFKAITTSGSFANKNIEVTIDTNETPIRLVTIDIKNSQCECGCKCKCESGCKC